MCAQSPEVAYHQITDLVARTAGPQTSPRRSSLGAGSSGKKNQQQRGLVSRLEEEFGESGIDHGDELDAAEESAYGIDGTPSKYATPREIPDLDDEEEEEEDDEDGGVDGDRYYDDEEEQDAAEQTAYEDAAAGDDGEESRPRNVAQISREILDSIFRAIGDAMRHHRTVFNHDLMTTHSAFSAFDRDGSGEINLQEFEAAMRRLDIPLSGDQLRQIFETFDANDNGTIEYTEFAQELHLHGQATEEEAAAAAAAAAAAEQNDGGAQQQQQREDEYEDEEDEDEELQVVGTGKITYEIDDDDEDDDEEEGHYQDDVDESYGNLTMGVIVEEPMEEIEEITPSPRPSPSSRTGSAADAGGEDAGGGGAADSSVLRDTEADLQYFVEEWRTLDVQQTNSLSLKELAILLQRLPVPMGVGDQGGAEELGELMTQLLASQEVPVVNGAVGFREVGLWMVKQLTVFSQQQEQAEAAAAAAASANASRGSLREAEDAEEMAEDAEEMAEEEPSAEPDDDEYDDEYDEATANQQRVDDSPLAAPQVSPARGGGNGVSSRPSPLQSPPPSPVRPS